MLKKKKKNRSNNKMFYKQFWLQWIFSLNEKKDEKDTLASCTSMTQSIFFIFACIFLKPGGNKQKQKQSNQNSNPFKIHWTNALITRTTWGHNSRFQLCHCNTDTYLQLFFPRTAKDSNLLSTDQADFLSLDAFKSALEILLH